MHQQPQHAKEIPPWLPAGRLDSRKKKRATGMLHGRSQDLNLALRTQEGTVPHAQEEPRPCTKAVKPDLKGPTGSHISTLCAHVPVSRASPTP
jgi:hypothetical protein